jgi:hypothetical protein
MFSHETMAAVWTTLVRTDACEVIIPKMAPLCRFQGEPVKMKGATALFLRKARLRLRLTDPMFCPPRRVDRLSTQCGDISIG